MDSSKTTGVSSPLQYVENIIEGFRNMRVEALTSARKEQADLLGESLGLDTSKRFLT